MIRRRQRDPNEEDIRKHGRSMSKFQQILVLTLILLSRINVCKSNINTRNVSTQKPTQDINQFIVTLAGNHARITTAVLPTKQSLNLTNSSTKEHTTDPQIPTTDNDRKVCTDFPMPGIEYKEMCCRRLYKSYANVWINGARYLVVMLERLQRWRCNEFDDECKRPTWDFCDYTRRMYDLFCNRSEVETACHADIVQVARRYQFVNESLFSGVMNWKDLIEKLDSSAMEFEDLVKSCVQIALFDRSDGGVGRFHEIIEQHAPFCGLQWHGYDFHTAQSRGVSPWTGMPSWCRHSIITCIAFMITACITTIFGNILILCVFGTTAKLRDAQGVYKISLAFVDLMTGVVVWPNMIILQYLTFFKPRHMGAVIKQPYRRTPNMTPYDNADMVYRYGGGEFGDIFDNEFVMAIGFFYLLGSMLSIAILLCASVDRFWAVFRPLTYNPYAAKRRAVRLNGFLWFLCIVICLLPVFTPGVPYIVASSNFIFPGGDTASAMPGGLFIPLVMMWVLTGMTYYACRKHTITRKMLVTSPSSSRRDLEKAVVGTLAMMVVAFSVSVVPVLCTNVVRVTSSVTNWQRPRTLSIYSLVAFTTSEYLAVILLTSNSLWNIFIYNWRVQEFRKAALGMFRERFGRWVVSCGVAKVSSNTQDRRRKTAVDVGCSNNTTSPQIPPPKPYSDGLGVKQPHVHRQRLSTTVNSVGEITSNDNAHSMYDQPRPPKPSNTRRHHSPTSISAAELRDRRRSVLGSFVFIANTANLYQSVMSSLTKYIVRANPAQASA